MTSGISKYIWESKYRYVASDGAAERSVEDTLVRVARAAAMAESSKTRKIWERRFLDILREHQFIPAGRILAGAGTARDVTLFNCFVMGEVGDDMSSIFAHVREAALTLQRGGGIGQDFSPLRPKGAPVKGVGADASGPVSFMDVWDSMCKTIMSAGSRRGAMMGTLRCDHPDIEAFVEAKADPARLRNFNISVLVTDAFLDAVRNDADWALIFEGQVFRTVKARGLWHKIMRGAYDYAEPGVIFIDRVNALNPLNYAETIYSTNPCVTADTWVQTANGPRQVSGLIGTPFKARIDGRDYEAPGGFFLTGTNPVLSVKTKHGYEVRLTAGHPVRRIKKAGRYAIESEWHPAGDLSPGDRIVLHDHRNNVSWEGLHTFDEGYLIGLLIGDGTLKRDKAVVSVWQGPDSRGAGGVMKAALTAAATLKRRADFKGWTPVVGRGEYRLSLGAVKGLAETLGMAPGRKDITPQIECASSEFYRGFLRGFFDADGSVQGTQAKGVSVRLAQSDLMRLKAVQRMLLRLGIVSRLYCNRRSEGMTRMPDGKGSHIFYKTKANHELIISGANLVQFKKRVGFSDTAKAERLDLTLRAFKRRLNSERFFSTVLSVVEDGAEPVYDVRVPGPNAFDAQGFYLHNCGEQPLPPYGACLLGSINLASLVRDPFTPSARLDETRLDEVTLVAVRFLDNIIDISRYPLPAQEKEARAKRRIGLGVTGLADALILCGEHYGSESGRGLAKSWMRRISERAYEASAGLASEKGVFPGFNADLHLKQPFISALSGQTRRIVTESGLRNGVLMSIAPTGTISLLAGNVSSGIEPVFDLEYERRILERDGSRRTELVQDYAMAQFRKLHPGKELPLAFVTAQDLSPQDHLLMQAALQPHIDASISKTVNCPKDIAFEDFQSLYLDAHRLGLKGCTAYRPNDTTGAVLVASSKPVAPPVPPGGVQTSLALQSAPMPRDPVLSGFTYKLAWPPSSHAMYVTINDTVDGDMRRPFEIFINSKNLEHYAWTVALTRMISAVFRRGGDVSFVVEELKAIFDPRGGAWMEGRYVPSLLAAIGGVIEGHLRHIGFLNGPEASMTQASASPQSGQWSAHQDAAVCPQCGSPSLTAQEGCLLCKTCGFSSCA